LKGVKAAVGRGGEGGEQRNNWEKGREKEEDERNVRTPRFRNMDTPVELEEL